MSAEVTRCPKNILNVAFLRILVDEIIRRYRSFKFSKFKKCFAKNKIVQGHGSCPDTKKDEIYNLNFVFCEISVRVSFCSRDQTSFRVCNHVTKWHPLPCRRVLAIFIVCCSTLYDGGILLDQLGAFYSNLWGFHQQQSFAFAHFDN